MASTDNSAASDDDSDVSSAASDVANDAASDDSSADSDKVRSKMDALSVRDRDNIETIISVSCWNIMGEASASDRKEVTTATFTHQYPSSSGDISLGQADIICIQEMAFNPSGKTAKDYLPSISNYGHEDCAENGTGNKHNTVFYKKEKFKLENSDPIQRAFHLMQLKREVYDNIERGGDKKKEKAEKGKLTCEDFTKCDSDSDKRKMCNEVLQECKQAGTRGFRDRIARYKAPGENETRSPEVLLKRRIALCHLGVKSLPGYSIAAISVHNYSGRSGRHAPRNFVNLLFDFLDKLEVPVLIAGDFNLTFTPRGNHSLTFENYEMESPRSGLTRIDYIAVNQFSHPLFDTTIKETKARKLQVPPTVASVATEVKNITNHNPLSAIVLVKKNEQ